MDRTADANEWWAGIGGQAVGPLSPAEVRARREAGEITASTLVWRAGFTDWRPAGEVPEVAAPRTPTPVVDWQPRAGSTLADLAGKELDDLKRARGASPQSGSPQLDELTSPTGTTHHDRAVPSALVTSTPDAVKLRPPEPTPRAIAAQNDVSSERRRTALLAGAGTFAMGAAVAVALVLVFKGGVGRSPAHEAVSAQASAAPVAAAATTPSAPKPVVEQPVAAAPAVTEKRPGAPDGAATAETPEPRANVVRGPVQDSATVRTSDPPPPAAAPARDTRAGKAASRERDSAKPAAVARRSPPAPRRSEKAAPAAASDPLAMARAPAPAAAPAAEAKPPSRDPLANLVTDSDLDRELGGGSSSGRAEAAPEYARPVADSAPARKAEAAVYVPPAPGSDLPEGVSPAQINEAVKARMGALRSCIDEQRATDPASKGTLKLRWVIGGDGNVKEVRNLSPEYEGKPISRCITGVVREIRFPTSRTAGQEVVFPFKF